MLNYYQLIFPSLVDYCDNCKYDIFQLSNLQYSFKDNKQVMSLEDLFSIINVELTDKMNVDTILFKDVYRSVYKVFNNQNCLEQLMNYLIANTPTSLPSKQNMYVMSPDSKKFVYIEDEITILIMEHQNTDNSEKYLVPSVLLEWNDLNDCLLTTELLIPDKQINLYEQLPFNQIFKESIVDYGFSVSLNPKSNYIYNKDYYDSIAKNIESNFFITKEEYHNTVNDSTILMKKFKNYTDSVNDSALNALTNAYTISISNYKRYNIKLQLINGINMKDGSIIIINMKDGSIVIDVRKIIKNNIYNYYYTNDIIVTMIEEIIKSVLFYKSDPINVKFDLNNNAKIITTVFISEHITSLIKSRVIKLKLIKSIITDDKLEKK